MINITSETTSVRHSDLFELDGWKGSIYYEHLEGAVPTSFNINATKEGQEPSDIKNLSITYSETNQNITFSGSAYDSDLINQIIEHLQVIIGRYN